VVHVERNGHHDVRGLARCSPRERRDATRLPPDLYRGDERAAGVRIEAGHVAVGSLDAPGYGIAFEPDLDAMTPLDRWTWSAMEAAT
jgi:hypothetical protein